jgi:hypothetical protein
MFWFFPGAGGDGASFCLFSCDDCCVLFYPAQTAGTLAKLRFRLSINEMLM